MWMRKPGEVSAPEWAPRVNEQHSIDGVLHIRSGNPEPGWWIHPPTTGWIDAGDGWEVLFSEGEIPTERELRRDEIDHNIYVHAIDGSWLPALPVHDLNGNRWVIPQVESIDGECYLGMKVRVVGDGMPERVATDLQNRLIKAAAYLRERLEARNEGEQLLCDIKVVAELLAASHHLTPRAIMNGGFLDDHLIVRAALAVQGVAVEEGA